MDNLLYVILFVVGLFVFMQLYIRISTFLKKGKTIKNIPGSLGKEVSGPGKHLIYFYTDSCAACKPMTPIVESMRKNNKNVHKVNLATNMELARTFGVMGTPSTIILENNKIGSFIVGVKNQHFLQKLLLN